MLEVHEWGDAAAPAIVCLHGITGSGARYRRLAEERLAARFRVLAPDLRGHGDSTYEPPWDLDTHLADIVEAVGARGVESATWLGHSFGGRLVLELVTRDLAPVERVILLDPAIWVPPALAHERAELARPDRSYDSLAEAVERRYAESNLHETPRELLEVELAEELRDSPDGRLRYRYCQSTVVAAYGELAKPPPLAPLGVPALLIHGAVSDVMPDYAVAFCRDTYGPLLEVATVPGGHVLLWDAFDETAEAIERFLTRTEA